MSASKPRTKVRGPAAAQNSRFKPPKTKVELVGDLVDLYNALAANFEAQRAILLDLQDYIKVVSAEPNKEDPPAPIWNQLRLPE